MMEKRLELMTREFVNQFNEDSGRTVYPETVLVWLNYVNTGSLIFEGIGYIPELYLEQLKASVIQK